MSINLLFLKSALLFLTNLKKKTFFNIIFRHNQQLEELNGQHQEEGERLQEQLRRERTRGHDDRLHYENEANQGPDHVQVYWKYKSIENISQLETRPLIG